MKTLSYYKTVLYGKEFGKICARQIFESCWTQNWLVGVAIIIMTTRLNEKTEYPCRISQRDQRLSQLDQAEYCTSQSAKRWVLYPITILVYWGLNTF